MKRPANHGARRALTDALRHMLADGEPPRRLIRAGYANPRQLQHLRTTVRVLPADRTPS